MEYIDFILIALLVVLVGFKRSRYAASCFLLVSALFLFVSSSLPGGYYFSASAGANTLLFFMLIKSYKLGFIKHLFSWKKYKANNIVAALSLVLILINIVGYSDYLQYKSVLNYNNSYTLIVCFQVAILYIGNMLSAYVDRYNYKLALASFLDSNNYEEIGPDNKEDGKTQ